LRSGEAHTNRELAVEELARRRKEEGGGRRRTRNQLLKSNNPHLAGGEQCKHALAYKFIGFSAM